MKGKKKMAKAETKEQVLKEEKALAPKAQAAMPASPVAEASWGSEGVDKSDIIIPKILAMQGLSKPVLNKQAQFGDLVDSVTFEKLGDEKTPLELIPIATHKTWVISIKPKGKDKFQYDRTEPWTAESKEMPFEDVQLADGSMERRDRSLNFHVLRASDAAKGEGMPYVISFRRTSYRAGKKLITHFTKMQMLKSPPAAKSVKLLCRTESNDDGTFTVLDIEPGRMTTKEELDYAFAWYKEVSAGRTKVAETVDEDAPIEAHPAMESGAQEY